MQAVISFAGRHGPVLLFVGVFLGLLVPALADAVRPLMGTAVFAFTLGAFLKVDLAALRSQFDRPIGIACVLLWTAIGVPAFTWIVLLTVAIDGPTKAGMLLCMLAPPVGSAAAIAAMLELDAALALVATVAVSLLSPLILPASAAALLSVHLHLDPMALTARIGCVIAGAACTAAAIKHWAPGFVIRNPSFMTGISVTGLLVVAIGAMRGVQPDLLAHPMEIVGDLAVAFTLNAGFQVIGAVLFAHWGRDRAVTIGLVNGNRNVTLVWVAAMPWLAEAPEVERFLVAAVFPIFMLPLVLERLLLIGRSRLASGRAPYPTDE